MELCGRVVFTRCLDGGMRTCTSFRLHPRQKPRRAWQLRLRASSMGFCTVWQSVPLAIGSRGGLQLACGGWEEVGNVCDMALLVLPILLRA